MTSGREWQECRHCGHIHDKDRCPTCVKIEKIIVPKTVVTSTGRRKPPKYGWGG